MVIPFSFCSDKSQIKLFIQCRNRYIKSIHFLFGTIAVCHFIRSWLKKLSSIFLGILCQTWKQVQDLFGFQTDVDGHFSIFYGQCSFSFAGLIYMEHAAVGVKVCAVGAVFQNLGLCGAFCFCGLGGIFGASLCLGAGFFIGPGTCFYDCFGSSCCIYGNTSTDQCRNTAYYCCKSNGFFHFLLLISLFFSARTARKP